MQYSITLDNTSVNKYSPDRILGNDGSGTQYNGCKVLSHDRSQHQATKKVHMICLPRAPDCSGSLVMMTLAKVMMSKTTATDSLQTGGDVSQRDFLQRVPESGSLATMMLAEKDKFAG